MNRIFFFIVCVAIAGCSSDTKMEPIREKFGTNKNALRKGLHLVPVDAALHIIEDASVEGRRFIFMYKPETEMSEAGFLRKIILLDTLKQNIWREEDYFKNPSEKRYLVTTHDYRDNQTTIAVQDIADDQYKGQPAYSNSWAINTAEADSVLQSWKVTLNPFK
ncbi:MAG: hypothetical protein QM731_28180 [Chitinophagaceae bacterium]